MNELITKAIIAMAADLIKAHFASKIEFRLPADVGDLLNEIFCTLENGEWDGPVNGFHENPHSGEADAVVTAALPKEV